MNENFWVGKRVLVTGADGFMGSHLTEALIEKGAEVSAYVRGASDSGTVMFNLKNLAHVQNKIKEVIAGDIGNNDAVNLIRKNNPQIIFHLAADAYVNRSFEHPLEVMQSNFIGTLNVLTAVMKMPEVEQVVCTSSSEIYGTAQQEKINELHPLNPSSPYAASKVAADRYCYAYYNTYKLPVAIIRPFNTYGPRLLYDVIPKFIRLALHNEPITIYGSGEQSRDFTYVSDMIQAFLLMGSEKKAAGKAVNFGTGNDISIKEIAQKIIKLTGTSSEITHLQERLAEVDRLCCDYSKAKEMFGWEPKTSIEEGLKKSIEWARQYYNK
jgi:dTDP-glucose 4,6-dehydratase